MKKLGKFIGGATKKIGDIINILFGGIKFAILPALVWYGGTQTSLSRIKKYGAESPQGIEAANIANILNIVCGSILGIIALIVIIYILKVLIGKFHLEADSATHLSSYIPDYDTNNNQSNKSFDFNSKTTYIRDQYGNVTGTAKTYSYSDKYGGFENTEIRDSFGNKTGEIKEHKW